MKEKIGFRNPKNFVGWKCTLKDFKLISRWFYVGNNQNKILGLAYFCLTFGFWEPNLTLNLSLKKRL